MTQLPKPTMFKIELLQCPHGKRALSVVDRDGKGGTRITGVRCCKQWTTVDEFIVGEWGIADLRKAIPRVRRRKDVPHV